MALNEVPHLPPICKIVISKSIFKIVNFAMKVHDSTKQIEMIDLVGCKVTGNHTF